METTMVWSHHSTGQAGMLALEQQQLESLLAVASALASPVWEQCSDFVLALGLGTVWGTPWETAWGTASGTASVLV